MSIGKKSIARAVNAAAKAEETAIEAVAETVDEAAVSAADRECAVCEAETKQIPEKFRNVSVGDSMPAFLL